MKRLGWFFAGALLLHAQVEQLATSTDGRTLLVHSRFRLQGEQDAGAEGKIYGWQDGSWSRIAIARNPGNLINTPDVFDPFLSKDAGIIGWQIYGGCGVCMGTTGPQFYSSIAGVTLPNGFPTGTLRISANGRYVTGDNYPYNGVKYADLATGLVADVPVDVFTRPVVREIANDGTALLLIAAPKDPNQDTTPGVLALWKPGSDPVPIYPEARVTGATISATGGRVAFEAIAADNSRSLVVIDTQTGERWTVADLPSAPYQGWTGSFAKPRWNSDGTQLLYRSGTSLSIWNQVVLSSPEDFNDAVISGDGSIVWAATKTNRLLRLDVATGQVTEILSPLPASSPTVFSDAVPGSAVLLRGFGEGLRVYDADRQLPTVEVTSEGIWVQIPWEYSSSPRTLHQLLIRSANNPFEAVAVVPVEPEARPRILKTVHQDFRGAVSTDDPARAGEIVHVYLTGMGPLDQPLATGAAGPLEPLLHPVTPIQCRFLGSPMRLLDTPYIGYAVGMIGFYQMDLALPQDVVGTQQLVCTVVPPSGTYSATALLSIAPR